MELKEAMFKRHVVKKYINKNIEKDLIDKLNERINKNNMEYNLDIKLMINEKSAISTIIKLISAKNVKNYFIMAGNDNNTLDERLGYSGADLMLYAQTLGLNTWWIGETYNKNVSRFVDNKKVIGIIALGYGQTNGKQHKSKSYDGVATYEGKTPDWFKNGVEAALLAPTALNKQDFTITGKENKVKIECDKSTFTKANLGLIKYHFELGAGKENFKYE